MAVNINLLTREDVSKGPYYSFRHLTKQRLSLPVWTCEKMMAAKSLILRMKPFTFPNQDFFLLYQIPTFRQV